MAERGLCSRREADAYIERGLVFVDGVRAELGMRAAANAKITLATEARAAQARLATIILHKPIGYVSAQAEDGHQPAVTLVTAKSQVSTDHMRFQPVHLRGLAPAGRLDIDSTGLLILTQDGRVARMLIGEDSKVEKEYLVRVDGVLDSRGLALLNHGLELDGRQLKPAQVAWANSDQLSFVLREGRKRQIRRMCELVGLRVTGLKRVRIGRVRLGDLPVGQWRFPERTSVSDAGACVVCRGIHRGLLLAGCRNHRPAAVDSAYRQFDSGDGTDHRFVFAGAGVGLPLG
jgi:23S rRNA pseudouridine2604 synthase